MKKALILVLSSIMFFMFTQSVSAASYTVYTSNSACNVRIGPGTNYSIIKNGTDNVQVKPDQSLEYISLKSGTVNGSNGQWYEVKFDYAAREYTGYVWSNCVTTNKYSYLDDAAFESSINGFPNSYKPYLRKLHAMHNNWFFEVDNTNLDWKTSVSAESEKGMSAVSKYYPSMFYRDSYNPNGIVIDGYSWYAACSDAVAYYLDPRNFLNQKEIFMFEKLSYDSSQDDAVAGILAGSFMEGSFTENGVTKTYAQAFIEAARQTNVSATHLASRALQEMGTKMSSAASGTVIGYEGYYNFYNIGATSGADNYLKGLQYAKDHGWNGVQKAITGGAEFIGSGYITKGQNTIYFEKFNTSKNRTRNAYTHQYQTNIMAPKTESASVFNSYKNGNKLNNSYRFIIPVYNNMPADAFKLSRTDTVGGNENSNQNNNSNNSEYKPSVSTPTKVSNAGYNLNGNYITKLPYGSDISNIKSNLLNQGASTATSKTSGKIATGDRIEIDGKSYTAVIYGDVAGDGNITIKDLLLIKKHLLGEKELSGAYGEAANISKDGGITIKDLLLLKKQLLGQYNISQ